MDALQIRAQAAHSLVGRGLIDGETALVSIVWPSEAVEAASEAVAAEGAVRGRHSERTRLRTLELVDAGCSWGQAAHLVNVPKQTLATWIRKRRRELRDSATSTAKASAVSTADRQG